PARFAVVLGELLQQHADLAARALPALAVELAAGEEAQRGGHAAGLHALGVQRREAAADDELGAAAAHVHHQPRLARGGQVVRGAEEDQTAFGAASRRTVLVATARTRCEGRPAMRWPKRARQSIARARRSASSEPSLRRPAAMRTLSRSRSITRGSPCSMRATIRWKLFEPMSTAASNSPSRIGVWSAWLKRGFLAARVCCSTRIMPYSCGAWHRDLASGVRPRPPPSPIDIHCRWR